MFDNQLIADTELLADWPLDSDWSTSLADFFQSSHCTALSDFVCSQREQHEIYPPAEDVFNAFRYCSLADTNVVILGQDPYHGPGQAHGLCFSVPSGIKAPPSLRNIFVELNSDLDIDNQGNTDLTLWARQGVLLSTPFSPSRLVQPIRIANAVGKNLPISSLRRLLKKSIQSFSFYGASQLHQKQNLYPNITKSLSRLILRPYPRTEDFLAASPSQRSILIYGNWEKVQSTGSFSSRQKQACARQCQLAE